MLNHCAGPRLPLGRATVSPVTFVRSKLLFVLDGSVPAVTAHGKLLDRLRMEPSCQPPRTLPAMPRLRNRRPLPKGSS